MLRPPGLKILLLSLAMPGASWALGLGDIHVESALHQPLAAQIEIVGTTTDSSAGLSATIADEETFKRYGLERPAGLASTALTVRQDKLGHPVLVLRSTDTFPEPMVTFLVDLHSPGGELIREYTVLLDPPGLAPDHGAVEYASASQAPAAVTATPSPTQLPATETLSPTIRTRAPEATVAAQAATSAHEPPAAAHAAKPTPNTYKIARRDTLARIATIAGAHSASDRRKMMVAIYRANPSAFRTNLNMLHTGATLHLPTMPEASQIPTDEANREFAQHMAAWHSADHRVPVVASAPATTAPATASSTSLIASTDAETAALTERVRSLEKSLHELQEDLKQQPVTQAAAPTTSWPTAAISTPAPAGTTAASPAAATSSLTPARLGTAPVPHRGVRAMAIAGGIGLALAAAAFAFWVYRRRQIEGETFFGNEPVAPRVELELPLHRVSKDPLPLEANKRAPQFPAIDMSASYLVEELQHNAEHTHEHAAHAHKGAAGDDATTADHTSEATNTSAADVTIPGTGASTTSISVDAEALALLEEASLAAGIGAAPEEPTVQIAKQPRALDAETTALLMLPADLVDDTAAREFAFFNPESANNTTTVKAADAPDEPPKFFVERRRNAADVLRQAIEREPERSDLRLKLLELYYNAAAQNRRAFLEAAHQLANNEQLASAKDWSQISDMGRTIAPDDDLFNNGLDKPKQAVA